MEIKFSFIVPVYNIEKYIEKCIKSILNQKYSNIELILVDDGSSDQSGIICDRYEKEDERIRVLHQKNAGVSSARNNGLKHASGNWIIFVDGDDWVSEELCQKLLLQLTEEYDVCWFSYADVYAEKRYQYYVPSGKSNLIFSEEDFELCIRGVFNQDISCKYDFKNIRLVTPWAKCYRRDFLINNQFSFTEGMKIGEDMLFNLNVYTEAKKGIYLCEPMYFYRISTQSVTKKFNSKALTDYARILEEMEKWFELDLEREKYRNNFYERVMIIIGYFVVLYICNKNFEATFSERKKIYSDILAETPYSIAKKKVNLKNFSFRKRILMFLIKNCPFGLVFLFNKANEMLEKYLKRGIG